MKDIFLYHLMNKQDIVFFQACSCSATSKKPKDKNKMVGWTPQMPAILVLHSAQVSFFPTENVAYNCQFLCTIYTILQLSYFWVNGHFLSLPSPVETLTPFTLCGQLKIASECGKRKKRFLLLRPHVQVQQLLEEPGIFSLVVSFLCLISNSTIDICFYFTRAVSLCLVGDHNSTLYFALLDKLRKQ